MGNVLSFAETVFFFFFEKIYDLPTQMVDQSLHHCGLSPGQWEEAALNERIKESQLTQYQTTKMRNHLEKIFGAQSLQGKKVKFYADDLEEVAEVVIPYLKTESMLIEDLPFDITIVGDLHGQLYDLYRVFHADEKDGKPGYECMKYLFLGNYVDRGCQSLEVVMALFCLKMLYPDRIFLLRGNHEFSAKNSLFGFERDFTDRFPDEATSKRLFLLVNHSFSYLSSAAIVGNTFFCAHAGIPLHGCFSRRRVIGIRKPIADAKEDLIVHELTCSDIANDTRVNSSTQTDKDELSLALYCVGSSMLIRGNSKGRSGYELMGNMCLSLCTATGTTDEVNDGAVAYVDANGEVTVRTLECDPKKVAWNQSVEHGGKAEKHQH